MCIANTRMQGVPVQNPVLRVQAIGFEPLALDISGLTCLPVGQKARRMFGSERFEFTGADEHGLGAFDA